jgi:hypothetical protein
MVRSWGSALEENGLKVVPFEFLDQKNIGDVKVGSYDKKARHDLLAVGQAVEM